MNRAMIKSLKSFFQKLNKFKESSFHRLCSFFKIYKSDSSITDSEEVEILDNDTEYLDGYYYDEDVYYSNGSRLDTINFCDNQRNSFL